MSAVSFNILTIHVSCLLSHFSHSVEDTLIQTLDRVTWFIIFQHCINISVKMGLCLNLKEYVHIFIAILFLDV